MATILIIPTDLEIPFMRYPISIGGEEFVIGVRYNERTERYYVDIYDTRENLLISGEKCLANGVLLRTAKWRGIIPNGIEMITISLAPSEVPPSIGELGDGQRVELATYER